MRFQLKKSVGMMYGMSRDLDSPIRSSSAAIISIIVIILSTVYIYGLSNIR